METRTVYEQPHMEVVRLQPETSLLNTSGDAGMQDYTVHDYYEE